MECNYWHPPKDKFFAQNRCQAGKTCSYVHERSSQGQGNTSTLPSPRSQNNSVQVAGGQPSGKAEAKPPTPRKATSTGAGGVATDVTALCMEAAQ
eukprot:7757444-Karenia_brevis.AAC.1